MPGQIEPIERMVSELSRLPGIGHKTAARLAYHIVGMPLEDVHALAAALWQGRKAIRYCDVCGNFSSAEKCAVCADESRHNGQICVVRDPRDVAAMERMHDYHGLYHVLHGTLSPMDGIGPDDDVVILGSGLTMIDVVLELEDRGWRGRARRRETGSGCSVRPAPGRGPGRCRRGWPRPRGRSSRRSPPNCTRRRWRRARRTRRPSHHG